jgi:hypothetical protein
MQRRLFATLGAACVLLTAVPLAAQSVPTTINYQGRLLQNTSDQAAVPGSVDIVFSIWSGPVSDGAAVQLWSESWTGVGLSNGIFSVLLGSNGSPINPADFQNDSSLYLQLEIDGETLQPRQQLGSAPFAIVDEPANELQDLTLTDNSLGLSNSAETVDLSGYLDNTDNQQLSLSGNNLSLTSDDGTDVVSLSAFSNTDDQTLSLSGTNLSISGSGSTVNLSGFLDNTDSQNLNSVLINGNDANNRDITNVDDFDANDITAATLDCPNCVDSADIANDTIRGNDINDNIYILHIDCNGSCANMSMKDACNVIENLRGLSVEVELIGVSCVHDIPSTSGNGFVPCNDGSEVFGDYECRAFNLRTLGDIPCVGGDGTDAIVTCLETDIPK